MISNIKDNSTTMRSLPVHIKCYTVRELMHYSTHINALFHAQVHKSVCINVLLFTSALNCMYKDIFLCSEFIIALFCVLVQNSMCT